MVFIANLYHTQEGNGAGFVASPPHPTPPPCAAEYGDKACACEG